MRIRPVPPPKNDNPLDPRNLLPFTRELHYEENHKPIEQFRVANEPYRKQPGRKRRGKFL